ncbi:MAG: hypothetical protein GY814_17665 [Gammaproteobacteria bacterium]|nr:hypothetical protein [Gammaproteobacteria bacterium]
MTISTIIGTGGHALLLSAVALQLARGLRPKQNNSHILVTVLLTLALIPIGPLSAAQFSRGLFGDLSIISILLLGRFLLLPQASRMESRQLFILLCIIGTLFYPAALGLGMTDPYQWGYLNSYRGIEIPMLFLGGIILVMVIAGQIENHLIMLCILTALGAFTLEFMESRNLWDYLIDPMIFIYSLINLAIYLTKQMAEKYRARKHTSN